jgi:fatty-acyl-CoA synthase
MHGAAQWSTFHMFTGGGRVVLPENVVSMDPVDWLRTTEREGVMSIPVVGDAMARPLIDEIERGDYDLSGLAAINNGGAPITPGVRHRIHEALPNILILDAVGSSETGIQMNHYSAAGAEAETAVFSPEPDTGVVDDGRSRVLEPGEGGGWLARRGLVPLGYLGDAGKTAQTFPVIDGIRYSVPGDRAELLEDGRIRLLGRDSVTINSGGEKIFAEEVERALAAHPDVADVIVAGRPSERWGSEVVAILALRPGSDPSDEELLAEAGRHVARYKLPKAIIRRPSIARSPSGKADYRWAKAQAATE